MVTTEVVEMDDYIQKRQVQVTYGPETNYEAVAAFLINQGLTPEEPMAGNVVEAVGLYVDCRRVLRMNGSLPEGIEDAVEFEPPPNSIGAMLLGLSDIGGFDNH